MWGNYRVVYAKSVYKKILAAEMRRVSTGSRRYSKLRYCLTERSIAVLYLSLLTSTAGILK